MTYSFDFLQSPQATQTRFNAISIVERSNSKPGLIIATSGGLSGGFTSFRNGPTSFFLHQRALCPALRRLIKLTQRCCGAFSIATPDPFVPTQSGITVSALSNCARGRITKNSLAFFAHGFAAMRGIYNHFNCIARVSA